jgi:hypothetical protein
VDNNELEMSFLREIDRAVRRAVPHVSNQINLVVYQRRPTGSRMLGGGHDGT